MKTKRLTSLGKQLLGYGIGAGAASIAAQASADVVYSGPVEFTGNTIYYDLQNVAPPSATEDTANHDFELNLFKAKASNLDSSGNTAALGETDSVVRGVGNFEYAVRHSAGDTIGSGGSFFSGPSLQNDYAGGIEPAGQNLGDWNPGDRGFLGLRLTVGTDVFYGWADVTLNTLDGTNNNAFTLHGYAFDNTAGTALQAGAVPEPNTIALLAAGALGVLALKRRRAKS